MRLADLLLGSRTIDEAVLHKALTHGAQVQRPLANVLVAYQVVEARRIARLLSRALKVDVTDVLAVTIHPRVLELIPRHAAERFRVLPVGVKSSASGNRLYLAMSDPTDADTVAAIAAAVGLPVEPMLCDDAVLQRAFDVHYRVVVPDPMAAPMTMPAPPTPPPTPDPGFLTDSTADALFDLEYARPHGGGRVGDPRRGAVSAALGLEPTGSQPLPEPVAVGALVDEAVVGQVATAATSASPAPSMWAPPGVVFGAPLDLPPDHGDDPFGGESLPPDAAAWAASQEGAPLTVTEAPSAWSAPAHPLPSASTPGPMSSVASVSRVIVASTVAASALRELLWERLGPVEVVADAAAACAAAIGQPAVVLVEPSHGNELLRALLEFDDLEVRPRVVIVGGDASLRFMGCVDLQVEMPPRRGDLVDVIHGALRQVGIAS